MTYQHNCTCYLTYGYPPRDSRYPPNMPNVPNGVPLYPTTYTQPNCPHCTGHASWPYGYAK